MELRQLRSLLAVEEAGSFSAAAEALDTVQSNISSHISRLEGELNTRLIDRRTGTLTEEGQIVARRSRRLLEELEEIYTDLDGLKADITGRVRLGIIATTASWLLPLLLEQLSATHPRLEIEIAEGTAASLQRRLHSGNIDLALLTTPLTIDGLTFESLYTETYVLVIGPDHPLAQQASISLYEAVQYPLIVPPSHIGFREELEAMAATRGLQLHHTAEIDGLHVVAILALAGYGSAILPSSAILSLAQAKPRLAIPIVDLNPRRVGIGRYRNRIQSAASKAVVETLLAILRSPATSLPDGISSAIRNPGRSRV
ncbi:MAG: LysR family transcriptional regulator [Ferrimicrobium sp.]|jgi:DNA-binding transcriptional LysR family regulator|uniref:LysR family transcriptional regulator n=1 Tax=Ferrimicrobium acidiphilum TaxID=121039 RepID=A0ABV3Y1T2_9ACTN|nr:LysR family transcriptional regulator [Ferrimicrobium sp.]